MADKENKTEKQLFLDEVREKAMVDVVEFMKTWFKFDSDRNGSLDKEEVKGFLKSILEKAGKANRVDEYYKNLMKYFDTNSDGKIELNEFAQILPLEDNFLDYFQGELDNENFEKIFNHYDQDANHFIEDDELSAFMVDLKRSQLEDDKELDIPQLELDNYKKFIMDCCGNKDGRFSKQDLKLLMITKYLVY